MLTETFSGCRLDRSFFANKMIGFTGGEPAINVYTAGGGFKAHQDKQSLTILVSLSPGDDFAGGGTAFWSTEDAGPPGRTREYLTRTSTPTLLLRPPVGTALLFGGVVTHAGVAITSGERSVLVASFSPSSGGDGRSDFSRRLLQTAPELRASIWILGALEGLDGL